MLLFAVGYLYRDNQKLHRDRMEDYKAHAQALLAIQSSTVSVIQGATTAIGAVHSMLEDREESVSTPLNGAKTTRRTKP